MLSRSVLFALALATTLGCTAHEGDATTTTTKTAKPEPTPDTPDPRPEPEPEPVPEPEPAPVLAKASIASVVMIEDCPDRAAPPPPPATPTDAAKPTPEVAPPAADEERAPAQAASMVAPSAKVAPGAALADAEHGWSPPCSQSTMQISFTGQGDAPGRVMIERVRLLEPGTFEELGRISARHPASWTAEGYFAWDETLPAGGSVKASYSLSLPDWTEVERKKAGASSYGHMFVLEVEVSIDGVSQTVRSQEFPREEAHVVVT